MKKNSFLSAVFLVAALAAGAQTSGEHLVPLPCNPAQQKTAQQFSRMHSRSLSDTVVVPSTGLFDNFIYNSNAPDSTLWRNDYSERDGNYPGVYINRTWAVAPPDLGVCTFDGLDYKGEPYDSTAPVSSSRKADELDSRFLDLSAYHVSDSVYLSFWYEAQGLGYAPNPSDSLLLDFDVPSWNPNQTTHYWKNTWYKNGYTPLYPDTGFHLVMIKLDSASYFVKGFQFRFRNYATVCGSNDHWHIDDVYLKSNRTATDTFPRREWFVYEAPSVLSGFRAVPWSHYRTSMMASNMLIPIRSNENSLSNATYWYDVYDQNNVLQYSYPPSAYGLIPPFTSSGYLNYAPMTDPPMNFQVPLLTDSGAYHIVHYLKQSSSDTIQMEDLQRFYNYYAYDDGTAEAGYGTYGAYSQLAYKFTLPAGVTDTLKAVQMYFLPVIDITTIDPEDWALTVWSFNSSTGGPGTVIYRQRTQHIGRRYEGYDRFATYTIDSAQVALSGTFFIGWQQIASDRMYVGFDANDDQHDKIYWNTSGSWQTSIFHGSLMIRPVFADVYNASGIQNSTTGNFSAYPNPAADHITLKIPGDNGKNYRVSVFDLSGREVTAQQLSSDGVLDVSALNEGVYILRLSDAAGNFEGTQRIVIAR